MGETREFIIESPKHGKHTVLIDEEDWEKVSQYKWRLQAGKQKNEFYAKTEVRHQHQRQQTLMLHRLIMDPPSGFIVDHQNHNGLDNRKSNLRICTVGQNNANRRGGKNNSFGYKGIRRRKNCKSERWEAYIGQTIGGKSTYRYLGLYAAPEEAARAYDAKAIELYGEYAYLNFPEEHNRKE
jgi:hypothetical protein